MAPALMGQHKDLLCPECGFRYSAGASSEAEEVAQQRGNPSPSSREIVAATCPLCRYSANVDPRTAEGSEYPTYGGDRILVSKFGYEFGDPRRWDVMVFRYPGEAQTNYIKRLVGLPGETVQINHGDIYIKSAAEDNFRIERRSPTKLRAMAQIVYDNDYVVDAMTKKGWPLRWQPWPQTQSQTSGGWASSDGGRSYEIDGSTADVQWLRYRHFVPSFADWELMEEEKLPSDFRPRPLLITDFYAYDTSVARWTPVDQPHMLGLHWVGDLLVECQLDVKKASGTVLLELVKGGRHFRCELDCQSGQARLSIDGLSGYQPKAQTAVRGPSSHRVAFANVDDQLTLWVDGSAVQFDSATSYEPLGNEHPKSDEKDPGDLAPSGIASQGAALRVSHLRLLRDIYYISATGGGPLSDYNRGVVPRMNYEQLIEFFSSPARWEPPGSVSPFDERQPVAFTLADDQFFVLGDNSPFSQDARLWTGEKFVSRELLIGKALLIFWPHSFNQLPGARIPFPFFPNFARMGFIR
ncbi:MAG: signal peptidase I [Planctomycetia bacterium]|nr:signal peptidase I [Planctomycetia bacterium]